MVQAFAQTDPADTLDRGALALKEIVVLSDGVAGHDRSSEGIVLALQRLGATQVAWAQVRERTPRSRRVARINAAVGPWAGQPERFAHFAGGVPAKGDIIVSTGPATAAANIALAKSLGARNIYYGFPKRPVLGVTTLLSPLPFTSPNVALAQRPSAVDGTKLPAPRPFDVEKPWLVAVLFGGDSKHYSYTDDDLRALADACLALVASAPALRVEVYDSRRTSPVQFDQFADRVKGARAIEVHRFRDGGLGSNAQAFKADAIVVTADSLSMVSEAIAAGRPTLVAAPMGYTCPSRDEAELAALAGKNRIQRGDFASITSETLAHLPRPPRQSNPAALAALLSQRGF